jgi:hypothetical protein
MLDRERRALILALAVDADPTAVELDQLAHDRQPRPSPPCRRVDVVSACRKRSKTTGRNSGAMPCPVSVTMMRASWPSMVSSTSTRPPPDVNFTAFDNRFHST